MEWSYDGFLALFGEFFLGADMVFRYFCLDNEKYYLS